MEVDSKANQAFGVLVKNIYGIHTVTTPQKG